MNLLIEMVEKYRIKVRIMIPAVDEQQIEQIVNEEIPAAMRLSLKRNYHHHIDIRSIDKNTQTSIGILVGDRKESLIIETKDDTKDSSYDAAGLSVYSNSKPIALSYASIFETLWKQNELYEQLKIHDKMQKEFINIAAHELRTPIQPIIGLSEVVLSNTKNKEQAKLLEVVNRNAKRLHRLTEDILDVTKIESQSLNLNKEQFNLNEVITNAIEDMMTKKVSLKAENRNDNNNNDEVKFLYTPQDVFVYADKGRISQVIHNLLDNAVKSTKHKDGTITVMVKKKEKEREQLNNNNNDQQVIVSIKDTGKGIDPQIVQRLFTKFATKSETGTGLGLFICKGIVEAHEGKIWAEDNPNGKGATFSFSLPLANQ
jgi:signal transduction histidine kinase